MNLYYIVTVLANAKVNTTVRSSDVYLQFKNKEESVEGMCSHYIIIVFSRVFMLTDVDLAGRLSYERKVPGSNPI